MRQHATSRTSLSLYWRILIFLVVVSAAIFILSATFNSILIKKAPEIIESNSIATGKNYVTNVTFSQQRDFPSRTIKVPISELLDAMVRNALNINAPARRSLTHLQTNKYLLKAFRQRKAKPMKTSVARAKHSVEHVLRGLTRQTRSASRSESVQSLMQLSRDTSSALDALDHEYIRCKKSNEKKLSCTDVYARVKDMLDEFATKIYEMKALLENRGLFETTQTAIGYSNPNPNVLTTTSAKEYVAALSTTKDLSTQRMFLDSTTAGPDSAKKFSDSPAKPIESKMGNKIPEKYQVENSKENEIAFGEQSATKLEAPLPVGNRHPPIHEDLPGEFNVKMTELFREADGLPVPFHVQSRHFVEPSEIRSKPELFDFSDNDGRYMSRQEPHPRQSIGASGPFMELCDKLQNKAGATNTKNKLPAGSAFMSNPTTQFTSHGSTTVPVTGETMKASAQIVYNPGFGMMQAPTCVNPAGVVVGTLRAPANQFFMQPMNYGVTGFSGYFPVNQAGYLFTPMAGSYPQHTVGAGQFLTIAGNMANLPQRNIQPSQLPFYAYSCIPNAPMPQSQTVQPSFRHDFTGLNAQKAPIDHDHPDNIPQETDIIYSIYGRQAFPTQNDTNRNSGKPCQQNQIKCTGTSECIARESWCDAKVDCADSSDEISCTCKSRLVRSKICDGYADCPMAEDELGCFGCDKFQLTCYNDVEEFNLRHRSTVSMCYNIHEKCDGSAQCLNKKDEQDCNMIVGLLGHHLAYTTSFTEGILHRNYKGKWYPVCNHPLAWAREACAVELGYLDSEPFVSHVPGEIPGQFIQPRISKHGLENVEPPIILDACPPGVGIQTPLMTYVKCPPVKCGTTRKKNSTLAVTRVRRLNLDSATPETAEGRVVGGKPCEPMQYPFVVGLYKDGNYHCGGIIYNDHWIVSAAHCLIGFEIHYYEVRVGMLRRFSYSPMVQTLKITHVVIHERYNRTTMANDLSLIRTEDPIRFNRWVRPICMPDITRPSLGPDWIWTPPEGTICTAVGWGAIVEDGPNPDELQQVKVPVRRCKHTTDIQSLNICAGDTEGGRDACQGDSGGPFFCKDQTNPDQWYLAGVVSHGLGCARPDEPGVYTRVSFYLDWIDSIVSSRNLNFKRPQLVCPGYTCIWGGAYCIPKHWKCNKIVNCLGGEDEADCGLVSLQRTMNDTDGSSTEPTTPLSAEFLRTTRSANKTSIVESFTMNVVDPLSDLMDISTERITTDFLLGETHHPLYMDLKSSKLNGSLKFSCRKIRQTVNANLRCDRIRDCEDGTDEEGCSCKDYFKGNHTDLLCDGRIDCNDLSDESDCACSTADFKCPLSRSCISRSARCDGKVDCPLKEDELDCFALTGGDSVQLDATFRPSLRANGLFVRNQAGVWELVCDEEVGFSNESAELAGKVCVLLGFRGYKSYNFTRMTTDKFKQWNRKTAPPPIHKHRYIRKHVLARDVVSSTFDTPEITELPSIDEHPQMIFHEGIIVGEESVMINAEPCKALFVECEPYPGNNFGLNIGSHFLSFKNLLLTNTSSDNNPDGRIDTKLDFGNDFTAKSSENVERPMDGLLKAPWTVHIFLNGSFRCVGALLDNYWIAADSTCIGGVRWDVDFLVAYFVSLGQLYRQHIEHPNGRNYTNPELSFYGKRTKIKRIDCAQKIEGSNLVLLHLDELIPFNRDILPTKSIQSSRISNSSECASIIWGGSLFRSFNWITEAMGDTKCDKERFACFKLKGVEPEYWNDSNTTLYGLIACKHNEVGWFPGGFFNTNAANYNNETLIPVQTLETFSASVQKTIGSSHCPVSYPPPPCPTHRCSLGKCLLEEEVCNGILDCGIDDGDENDEKCDVLLKRCHFSEMKCPNGKCVSKSKFCDHANDCGDWFDEPSRCSCLTYLRVTDSLRICDGIRNCWDKSDEDPNMCNCTSTSFMCGSSNQCVPTEFVCDEKTDCPNGEDERFCLETTHPRQRHDRDGYRQVLERNYGVWHTKCFSRSLPPNVSDVEKICHQLPGGRPSDNPLFRLIEFDGKNDSALISAYGEPTKLIITNKFSELKVNDGITLHIKPSRSLAQPTDWTAEDKRTCYMLEIKC